MVGPQLRPLHGEVAIMEKNEAALRRCDDGSAKVSNRAEDTRIIADYERGTFLAGIAMAISFALMGIGSVVFGW